MNCNTHRAPRMLPGLALALAPIGAATSVPAAESTINLKPVSVLITEAHQPPHPAHALAKVHKGQPVKIWCPVEVAGTAYQQLENEYVYWGAREWGLIASKSSAHLVFTPPLKIRLMLGTKGIEVYSFPKAALNPAFVADAPDAPPTYISYPFDNAGKPHMLSMDWSFTTEGKHTVRCRVDSEQSIKETTESDNHATATIMVIGVVKLHEQPQLPAAPLGDASPSTIQAPPSRVVPAPRPDATPPARQPTPVPNRRPLAPPAEKPDLNPQPEPPSGEAPEPARPTTSSRWN